MLRKNLSSRPGSIYHVDGIMKFNSKLMNAKGFRIMLFSREVLPVKVLWVDIGNESCYVKVKHYKMVNELLTQLDLGSLKLILRHF